MPELPDVETFRRYVEATALHQKIVTAEVHAPRMLKGVSAARLAGALEGSAFASTARHGKYLFVALGRGGWLLMHFGMTGQLKYRKDGGEALAGARLVVRFANGYCLAGFWTRRLGRIGLVEEPAGFVEAEGLGPDALDSRLDRAAFRKMLGGRRGMVKSALMDQGFIAGIGNIYSDEILFQAGIHPKAAARALDDDRANTLHRALRHVLRLAIERQADPERLPRSWLLPHRREGERCPRCGGAVDQLKVSGRSAYFCPDCQGRAG